MNTDFAPPPRPPAPLLPIVTAFAAGIVLSEVSGPLPAAVCRGALALGALSLAAAAGVGRSGHRRVALALVWLTALTAGILRHQSAVDFGPDHISHFAADDPALVRITGQVLTRPRTDPGRHRNPFLPYEPSPRTRFLLSARTWHTPDRRLPLSGTLQVTVKEAPLSLRPGDLVTITGYLHRPPERRNPGQPDWRRWYRLRGIHALLTTDSAALIETHASPPGPRRWLDEARRRATAALLDPLAADPDDRTRQLLDAMVLGQRSAAGRALDEAFLRTGGLHFLTVSGFHVGVLAGTVWLVVRRLLRRRAATAARVTLLVLALYLLLAEPRAPVWRATLMAAALCLAHLFKRPACSLNWLSLAALVILLANPLELLRPGFQLSFVQVLAILTVTLPLYAWLTAPRRDALAPAARPVETTARVLLRIAGRWSLGLVLICAVAWLVALPLVLLYFQRFAPWGALQSVVISPLVTAVVVLGFLTLLTAPLPIVGALVGGALQAACRLLLATVDRLAALPGTLVETSAPPAWLVAGTYLLAGVALVWWSRAGAPPPAASPPADRAPHGRLPRLLVLTALAALLTAGWGSWPANHARPPAGGLRMDVLSVGNGLTVLLHSRRQAAVYDVGTVHNFDAGQAAARAWRAAGVDRLDRVFISHLNFDHYSGLPTLLGSLPVGELVTNPDAAVALRSGSVPAALRERLPPGGLAVRAVAAGARWQADDWEVAVLWPPADLPPETPVNDRSLVLSVSVAGRRILLAGDADRISLAGLLMRQRAGLVDLRADVLLAPHHGAVIAGVTEPFLRAVSPRWIVVSSARPRPELRHLAGGLPRPPGVLCTAEVGCVRIVVHPDGALDVAPLER